MQHLNHPAIPKLVARGFKENRPYFVMTLAKGRNLQKVYELQQEEGGTISHRKMLRIADILLDALSYVHDEGIHHRDVTSNNVVVTESLSDVMLIDFGVCKGRNRPADAATFWKLGTSRFAPPDKLRYPTQSHSTQDVFAVGVLGYLLLTNHFPWSVGGSEGDRGALEDAMRSIVPSPIHQVNS